MSSSQNVKQHPAVIQASNKAQYYVDQLDKELSKYPALTNFEQTTQIPKAYAFLGGVVLVFVLHSINAVAQPVSNLLGWLLPAYLSIKAIESPSHADDIQWLTYWVVFGFFNFMETFAKGVILYYFPWYFATKTVFSLWLQLPAFRGAEKLYGAVVRPAFHSVRARTGNGATNSVPPESTAQADTLRERAAFATSD
ncbi:TB2/DP1, HVA22 family-domain-containing protein [Irpex rosettiformis]|uniref:TB2/DP1, HVA22 family-domain-containing protein n=1 Tax=Irpex rosettiformis TaxID=378272 RepID=A0ACB8U6K0_9APHY|nr:TB2/DP1, HVA22 family-domain-containing protein [Irpex rosettiformis]